MISPKCLQDLTFIALKIASHIAGLRDQLMSVVANAHLLVLIDKHVTISGLSSIHV